MTNEDQDAGRWTLSDLKQLLECATSADGHIVSTLRSIVKIMEEEQNSNFILGKVVIVNDLLEEDEVEDEDEEDE